LSSINRVHHSITIGTKRGAPGRVTSRPRTRTRLLAFQMLGVSVLQGSAMSRFIDDHILSRQPAGRAPRLRQLLGVLASFTEIDVSRSKGSVDRVDIFALAPDWVGMMRAHHRSACDVLRLLLRARSQQGVMQDALDPFFATGSKLQHLEFVRFITRPDDSSVTQMPLLERLCRRALYHPDVDPVAGARAGGGKRPMRDNAM